MDVKIGTIFNVSINEGLIYKMTTKSGTKMPIYSF